MLRAVLAATGTVAGLAALFTFRTHTPGITPVAAPSPAALTHSAPPSKSPSAPATKKAKKPAAPRTTAPSPTRTTQAPAVTPTKTAAPAPPKTSAPPAPTTQQFEGPSVDTQYGPVQVQITVTGGKITAANDVQQPDSYIGANAIPTLNQEVLTAQSANIQAVSGATYTSNGYIQSLQQAVNQAGLLSPGGRPRTPRQFSRQFSRRGGG